MICIVNSISPQYDELVKLLEQMLFSNKYCLNKKVIDQLQHWECEGGGKDKDVLVEVPKTFGHVCVMFFGIAMLRLS